jgi:hypothetical protein
VSKADAAIDRASERLREASESLEERGGMASKLAEPLAEDAGFLPKLKPSLVTERIKRDPTGSGSYETAPRPDRKPASSGGKKFSQRKVLPLVGGAFAGGFLMAKIVDWRGHAHPRG